MLRRHAYPTLGDRQLTSILPSDVQAWVKGLELAPATVGVIHGIASTIFKSAIRDRRVASNPCDGTKLPKVQRAQSVKTVQSRLGHASAVETLDTYSHLWPDSDDRTRDAIDSVLGFAADQLRTEMTQTS